MSSSYGNKLARVLISTKINLKSCKNVKITLNPWQIETKSIRYLLAEQKIKLFFVTIFTRQKLETQMKNVNYRPICVRI